LNIELNEFSEFLNPGNNLLFLLVFDVVIEFEISSGLLIISLHASVQLA